MFSYPQYNPYARINAVLLNPQPLPPRFGSVALNPQPLPPRFFQSGIIVVGG